MNKIRVVELFAGVGGFRIGLEQASKKFQVVWSSQWEPGASKQYASEIYTRVFGEENHSCEDIQKVIENNFDQIPDHDLLVGGFPCQDYSVARTLTQSKGLIGKKGVLWWSIYSILKKKGDLAPRFLFLENVDRLLKSPSVQRGRDFAVMLASLSDLGYIVEWRVINAADYGMPQRRRRVFILGYKKGTNLNSLVRKTESKAEWLTNKGLFAKAFPVIKANDQVSSFDIDGDLVKVSREFSKDKPLKSPFENAGVMLDRHVYTITVKPEFRGKQTVLGDVLFEEESLIPEEFFISEEKLGKWEYLKGAKKELRQAQSGHSYHYSEGAMIFPDTLDKPSRTIVTGEGGKSPSRFKHVIRAKSGRLRRLIPEELEKLNMFPVGHTAYRSNDEIVPPVARAFIMGNALVVGVIEKIGSSLIESIKTEK